MVDFEHDPWRYDKMESKIRRWIQTECVQICQLTLLMEEHEIFTTVM